MAKHYRKKEEGVITIFVSVMMLSVLSLGTLVLELGRLAAAKTQLADATLSAATSMIAGYDTDLYGRFGILSMDTRLATAARCRGYLEYNSDLSGAFPVNNISLLYRLENVQFTPVYNLTLPDLLRRQIMTQAKYNVLPENFALNEYNVGYLFADEQNACRQVADAMHGIAGAGRSADEDEFDEDAEAILDAVRPLFAAQEKSSSDCNSDVSAGMGMLPSRTGTVADATPVSDAAVIGGLLGSAQSKVGGQAGVLTRSSSTAPGMADASVTVDLTQVSALPALDWTDTAAVHEMVGRLAEEAAQLAGGVDAALSVAGSDRDGNLRLNSYAGIVFSDRNDRLPVHNGPALGAGIGGSEANFVSASLEYLFAGAGSEIANQERAWDYLFTLRYLDNLRLLAQQGVFADTGSDYHLLMGFAWAYYESCIDLYVLADGNGTVPFAKGGAVLPFLDKDAMESKLGSGNLDAALMELGVFDGGSAMAVGGGEPYTYRDNLLLALYMVPNSTKLLRMADLMQLEMRYRQRYVVGETPDFLMQTQHTYCRVEASARLNSVLPVIAQGSNGNMGALRFSSIRYVGY